jgi:hypothetical protein
LKPPTEKLKQHKKSLVRANIMAHSLYWAYVCYEYPAFMAPIAISCGLLSITLYLIDGEHV